MSGLRATFTVISAIVAAAMTLSAPALAASGPRPSLLSVESELMCTSCHEPLEAVSSPQAISEKEYVAGLIAKGDSNQQILNDMVSQYGVGVLAKPPASGFNLLIYVLPPVLLASGVIFLLFTLPKWRSRSRAAAARPVAGAPSVSEADAQRIDEDLARLI
ncbi:MAG: cytochrome c-type biogenesis protein CcmH [Solirubrobacteraceae bacterium]